MKKKILIGVILAMFLLTIPAVVLAESDGNHPPAIKCDNEAYKNIPVSITVSPQMIMYRAVNKVNVFVYKGKISISDFKNKQDSIKKSLLKTYGDTYTDVSQRKTYSYKPTVTGNITIIAARYINNTYSAASSQLINVKKSSSLQTFSINSPYGISKSIKGKAISVGFFYQKYYAGAANKVKVTIKRGKSTVKTKEYTLASKDAYSNKSFKYTPKKTGTYKFIFTGYLDKTACKSYSCKINIISPLKIKSSTAKINYAFYDRGKSPGIVQIGTSGLNGASKMKIYRAKTKNGKYSLVKTANLKGSYNAKAKYSSKYPYYRIKLSSGKYDSKLSSAVKVFMIGKVKNVSVSNQGDVGYCNGICYYLKKVSWSKYSGATGYNIYYKANGKKEGLYYVNGTSTSCTIYADQLSRMGKSTTIYVQPLYENSKTKIYTYGLYSDGATLNVNIRNN